MANPASYFSTLVQSSAAIVGFVVAFSTILYQLERREVNERTDALREEFKQLSERYEEVINNITSSLYMNTERYDKDNDYLRDTSLGQSELLEEIESDEELNRRYAAYVYGLCHRIRYYIRQIEDTDKSERYLLDRQSNELKELHQCTYALSEIMFSPRRNRMADDGRDSYPSQDIAKQLVGETTEKSEVRLSDDIINRNKDAIKSWIDSSTFSTNAWKDPDKANGQDFRSLAIVLDELDADVGRIQSIIERTKMTGGASFPSVTWAIYLLVGIGIFLPLASLFTFPSNSTIPHVSGWPLLLYQGLLWVVSGGLSIYLIHTLINRMA